MVELVDYKERWPADFRQIGTSLRNTLDSMAIRIDHIGSTSVPGMRAKDVLDIQVTVEAIERVVEARVLAAGFRQPPGVWRDHRPPDAVGPDEDWRKLFFHEPLGGRRINLHVRELGRPNQRYPLLFRDFLIAHPPMAAAYGELKVRLAACSERTTTTRTSRTRQPISSTWLPGAGRNFRLGILEPRMPRHGEQAARLLER